MPRRRIHQQATTLRLEREVQALIHSIATLQHQHLHSFASRGTHEGAPASMVAMFYRVFEHGLVPSQRASQDAFLCSMMASAVRGPDYQDVGALVELWRRCAGRVVWTRTVPQRIHVLTLDESTVVFVDVAISLQVNRAGIECLCPGTRGDESTIQQLLANTIDTHGFVRFEFDASSQVTWLSSDMDLISGLLSVLGSLSLVDASLRHGRIPAMTGLLSTALPNAPSHHAVHDRRHDIGFLLS